MNRSELRSFHAVARYAGFSRAAKALNISQPTLSTQVRALEDRYRVELFARVGRSVSLTPAGKALYEITTRLSQAEQDAETLLKAFSGLEKGKLSIAAVGPFHATDMIVTYKSAYPGIEIDVEFGNSKTCFEKVLSGEADIGIIANPPEDPRAKTLPYSKNHVVVMVYKGHPYFHRDHISLEDLRGARIIRREKGSMTRKVIERELSARQIDFDPVLELGSREAIWKSVVGGLGIGFVADFEFVPHENLRAIPISDAKTQVKYSIVFLHDRSSSPLVRSFCDLIVEHERAGTAINTGK